LLGLVPDKKKPAAQKVRLAGKKGALYDVRQSAISALAPSLRPRLSRLFEAFALLGSRVNGLQLQAPARRNGG
jgi:hypothetical protein